VELLFVLGVLFLLMDDFGTFIAWVTSMGFVVAPAFSYLNHKVMFSDRVAPEDRPPEWLRWWSIGTITILSVVGVMFVYMNYLM